MNPAHMLLFANLFFAGILAGMEVAIHFGLHPATQLLDDPSQFRLRQALVLRLRILVPAFFLPAATSGIAVAILGGTAHGAWLRCTGVVAVLIWAAIRVIGTVPINSATLAWRPEAPPKDWKAQIDHAERFHIWGVWAAVIAFASFLAAAAVGLAPY